MFLQKLKLPSASVFTIALLLCLSAFAGKDAHAQAAQTVEQAVGDVDAAYQAAPEASPSRKLFQAKSAPVKSTPTKSAKKKSRDFVEVHKPVRKSAPLRKAAPLKPHAAVEANDLMDGMRESLDPNAQVLAPASESTDVNAAAAKTEPARAPDGQHIIQPISSGKLFHPGKPAAKDVNETAANSLPAVTPPPSSSPTSLFAPEVKATPTATPATIDQPSKVAAPQIVETKKEEPKKDAAKTGAPLLSELSDAPTGAEDVKGVAAPMPSDKKVANEPAPVAQPAQQPSEAAGGFAKSRPLFSALGDKRKRPGITRVVNASPTFGSDLLPPVSQPAVAEPMIKPVTTAEAAQINNQPNSNEKSIWGAPKPEMTKGKVLYSQSADGSASTADKSVDSQPVGDNVFTKAEPENAPSSAPVAPVTAAAEEHDNIKSVIDASCGAAHGTGASAPPTANLCAQGNATTVIGRGPFMWTCQSADGNKSVECNASLQINAVCGSADGVATNAAPSTNLCRLGLASAVTGSGPYVWSCTGSGGGVNDNCQAPVGKPVAEEPKAVEDIAVPEENAAAAAPEVKTKYKDYAMPSKVPEPEKAANGCVPTVKRWTITCRQGGYPSNYTGVIVGETQVLCPTNVERGVWLTNSCAAPASSVPVSKSPGQLEVPSPSKSKAKLTDMLPDIAPMPVQKLDTPRKLFTPHYKRGAASPAFEAQTTEDITTINFAPTSEALDAQATRGIEAVVSSLLGDDKSIITLNAYAAIPADGDQQESRRLALARALAVRSYLMRKAIPSNRIDVRAMGPAGDTYGDDRVDIKVK